MFSSFVALIRAASVKAAIYLAELAGWPEYTLRS